MSAVPAPCPRSYKGAWGSVNKSIFLLSEGESRYSNIKKGYMPEQWTTVSVRGTGFAPTKKETLVQPPASEQEVEVAPENQQRTEPRRVGNVALKAAKTLER